MMDFIDLIKKSLGFEVDETVSSNKSGWNTNANRNTSNNRYSSQNPDFGDQTQSRPKFDEVETIIPDQSFYEIILLKPRTLDDINYMVDQVLEEKNPVILDLSFLENQSPANFKLAGDKIKQMRARYNSQTLLLSHTEDKNLIIVSPRKVRLVKK